MMRDRLIERTRFLDELSSRFEATTMGAGQVVLLSGEAGSGKTSLVTELVEQLPDGAMVRMVSCDAAGIHGPLGPVFDIVDSFGPRLAAEVQTDTAFDRVSRLILTELRSADSANVLIAEDLHWADQATLDLLRFLARRSSDTRTLTIATFRDDALEPDHELRRLTGDLASQANVSRIMLPPLSLNAVATLTEPVGLDARTVFDLTGGNPFFVSELVNSPSGSVPHTIREAILARTARLDMESRAVLELAAVAGPEVDPWLLRSAYGRDLAPELERSMHVGLLRSTSNGISFRHALTREVVLTEMSTIRRKDFAQRLLAELERTRERSRSTALLAHFAEEAGVSDAVRQYAVAAAEAAARLGAHRQAVQQYDRALRFSADLDAEEMASLLEARSFELLVTSQVSRSIEDISRAIELRSQLGDAAKLGADLRRRSRYYWIDGQAPMAETDALAALGALEPLGASPELAMAYSNVAQLRMLANRNAEAIEWGNRALELATLVDAAEARLHAMTNVGSALVKMGGDGWTLLDEAEHLGRELELHEDVARTFTNRAFSALEHHELQRAMDCARAGIAYTDEHDILSLGDYLHALLALAQLEGGERASPERELTRLLEIPYLAAHSRIVAVTGLALLLLRTGRDATTLLKEAFELAMRTGEFQRVGPVRAARAEAAWLAGDFATTQAEAEAGLALSVAAGHPWWNGIFARWIQRAGGTPDSAIEVAGPYRLELAGEHVEAAREWRRLGYPVQQARAMASSGQADQKRSAIELLLGVDGRPDANRIADQLRAMGASNIPKGPRGRTRQNPAQLTDRELEVLQLLALGKSNREIADALYISPRTCGHHVSAILAKLGVHSRSEAAAMAAELGLQNRHSPSEK